MGAEEWSGQVWFWIAAALIWARGVFGAYGAPRKLIKASVAAPEAAQLALDMTRYRLGRGRLLPIGLSPFRWPFLGAALAYAIVDAAFGELGPLIAFAVIAPIAAVDLLLETRVLTAIGAARDDSSALGAFIDELRSALRRRTAAALASILLTAIFLTAAQLGVG